jgi:hypothetical protein
MILANLVNMARQAGSDSRSVFQIILVRVAVAVFNCDVI